jgi:hypothetical protein
MRRRAQIGRPDRRRNRYPLASAEGVLQHNSPMALVHGRDASSRKRTLIVLATHTARLFRYKVELVAFGISASTLERNSFRIGEVFALL